jgi:hypothetical protein
MKSHMSWQEYRNLEFPSHLTAPKTPRRSLKTKLNDQWQSILAYFSTSSEPHVWQTQDPAGRPVWNAYDPVTHRLVEQVSLDEMRAWLEERHYQTL